MTGKTHRANENDPIALVLGGLLWSGYYESPFSTTTNSFTNLRLNTNFYGIDYIKNDGNVFKLEKEAFLTLLPSLDYFFVSHSLQGNICETDIQAALCTDHSPITLSLKPINSLPRRRSLWKFITHFCKTMNIFEKWKP